MTAVIPRPVSIGTGEGSCEWARIEIVGDITVDSPVVDLARVAGFPVTLVAPGARVTAMPDGGAPQPGPVTTAGTPVGAGGAFVGADGAGDVIRVEFLCDHPQAPMVPDVAADDSYALTISRAGVVVHAPEAVGLLRAMATLVHLAEPAGTGSVGVADADAGFTGAGPTGAGSADAGPGVGRWRWPFVTIQDKARYAWRGLTFDIARHFFGVPVLRQVMDLMVLYKFNVLHLHLTDDQAWRIVSPSRPDLVAKTADNACFGGPGGFLTAQDFMDVQAYAAARHILVVPEIDVPGHTNAATHAYPSLVPSGVPTDEYQGIEVGFSTLAFDLPDTEPFLRDVFTDLIAITQGPYIHFGGDEALSTDLVDYAKFVELCERIILDAGKKPVGWQEIADGSVRPGTLVQFWDTGKDRSQVLLRAAGQGARFLMTPAAHTYVDMKYTADYPLGQDWAGFVELRDSYDWDPQNVVPALDPDLIDGVGGAIFTETLREPREVFDMLLPRLPAIAEVAWSPAEGKDWAEFRTRIPRHQWLWRYAGWQYHQTPQVDWA